MRVVWLSGAEQDRLAIFAYIAEDNLAAAARMDLLFDQAAMRLEAFPMIGIAGRVPGTREVFPHKRYRLVYEFDEETVWILALVHSAQLWPLVRPE